MERLFGHCISSCLVVFSLAHFAMSQSVATEKNDITIFKSSKTVEQVKIDTSQLTFTAETPKATLVLSEPVIVLLRLANDTPKNLDVLEPEYSVSLSLKIKALNEIKVEGNLFSLRKHTAPKVRPMRPGDSIVHSFIFQPNAGLFTSTGTFNIQFCLPEAYASVCSKEIQVTVESPVGKDLLARKFLLDHAKTNSFDIFMFNEDIREQEELIKDFILNYSDTVFGEYAYFALGQLYEAKNEVQSAEKVFLKLKKDSKNIYLSLLVDSRIKKINEKKH